MKCKNCSEEMDEVEQGAEDGMITLIRKCKNCNWSCESWYDLDDCNASHISWLNDKKESVD